MRQQQQDLPTYRYDDTGYGLIFSLVIVGAVAGATLTFELLHSVNKKKEENNLVLARDDNGNGEDFGDDFDDCEEHLCKVGDDYEYDDNTSTYCSEDGTDTDTDTDTDTKKPKIETNDSLKRRRLPELIILVRHGESEGNIDQMMWHKKADHQIELTEKGQNQSADAGKRINDILSSYNDALIQSQRRRKQQQQQNWRQLQKLQTTTKIKDSLSPSTHCSPLKTKGNYNNNSSSNDGRIRNILMHVSPFKRTIQTAKYARPFFDQQIDQNGERRIVQEYHLCTRLREQEFGNMQGSDFFSYRQEQKKVGRFYYRFPTGER